VKGIGPRDCVGPRKGEDEARNGIALFGVTNQSLNFLEMMVGGGYGEGIGYVC